MSFYECRCCPELLRSFIRIPNIGIYIFIFYSPYNLIALFLIEYTNDLHIVAKKKIELNKLVRYLQHTLNSTENTDKMKQW